MTKYEKLVRDRIPDMIRAQGETPLTRVLNTEEYLRCLEGKLDEEVAEYHRDRNVEELADILEVILALAAANGWSREELEQIYRRKHDERGGFEERIYLIGKE